MKRILLLMLCASVFFVSCKKKNGPAPDPGVTLQQKISGSWALTKQNSTYYDASGKVVKTEDETPGEPETWEFLTTNILNVKRLRSDGSINTLSYHYSVTNENSKTYISLSEEPNAPLEVNINNSNMTLTFELPSDIPEYSKERRTFYFTKK
jgi:hypothetical protein